MCVKYEHLMNESMKESILERTKSRTAHRVVLLSAKNAVAGTESLTPDSTP